VLRDGRAALHQHQGILLGGGIARAEDRSGKKNNGVNGGSLEVLISREDILSDGNMSESQWGMCVDEFLPSVPASDMIPQTL
jgi:hypothetical protein